MKDRYDFSKGKRGRVLPPEPEPAGKTRITIRLDQDIVDRFFRMGKKPVVRPGIKPLSMGRCGSILRERYRGSGDAPTHHSRGVEIERCLNSNLVKLLAALRRAHMLEYNWRFASKGQVTRERSTSLRLNRSTCNCTCSSGRLPWTQLGTCWCG